ncbi:hypothetical protein [Portibacter marinus]|uniref:hypothetical protein n=1 Tax=Portibacter marinus TaxID=2898660 RepID=UPI001F1D16A4|nr:hypothetical protein [Portibacter marinus]
MDLTEKFISKLEERYGVWNKNTSRFGTTTFGVISKDLSISASQFTKLIYGNGTQGMYERSIDNIQRLIEKENLAQALVNIERENQQIKSELEKNRASSTMLRTRLALYCVGFVVVGAILGWVSQYFSESSKEGLEIGVHPLSDFFDKDFNDSYNSPYLDINEVQTYCPCSAYEGSWSLSEDYKLPIPGSRKPGVYYLAKSADVRMKCSRFDTIGVGKGRVLNAFEYLINEIWVDTEMAELSPQFFDMEDKTFTEEFRNLNFEENNQFQKVATIHSFFIDKFEIYPDSIVRKGEPAGRYATDIDETLASTYEIDIKFILNNVLGNLITTNCSATENEYCDPNDLKENESTIDFQCQYTIKAENLGIGGGYPYTKGYRLVKQNYGDNLICSCD